MFLQQHTYCKHVLTCNQPHTRTSLQTFINKHTQACTCSHKNADSHCNCHTLGVNWHLAAWILAGPDSPLPNKMFLTTSYITLQLEEASLVWPLILLKTHCRLYGTIRRQWNIKWNINALFRFHSVGNLRTHCYVHSSKVYYPKLIGESTVTSAGEDCELHFSSHSRSTFCVQWGHVSIDKHSAKQKGLYTSIIEYYVINTWCQYL